ncbi:MAG: ATP phosphoribosyltransferase [Candidatus Doudnabacteria bacterium]
MGLVLGSPKGSLEQMFESLMKEAGLAITWDSDSFGQVNDQSANMNVVKLRPQDIPLYVMRGNLDLGVLGQDCLKERGLDKEVEEIMTLPITRAGNGKVKIALFVPNKSSIKTSQNLRGLRVVTEFPVVSGQYFEKKGIDVQIDISKGATETIVKAGFAEAGVDIIDSGNSLAINDLRIIDVIMESWTVLIANHQAFKNKQKRQTIENIKMILQGVIMARDKVFLEMNVPANVLEKILKLLPALREPTVSNLSSKEWFAVKTVVPRKDSNALILQLKKNGAEGIVQYPIDKVL